MLFQRYWECLMGFSTNVVKIQIMLLFVFKNSIFLTTCQIRRIIMLFNIGFSDYMGFFDH